MFAKETSTISFVKPLQPFLQLPLLQPIQYYVNLEVKHKETIMHMINICIINIIT